MIATVFIPNGIAIILLLVLFFSSGHVAKRTPMLDDHIFNLMLICNLFQCVGEIFTYSIDGMPGKSFRIMAFAGNSALFIVNILFSYLWVIYADYKIFESVKRIRSRARMLAIPAGLVILGSILNLITPIFFRITADNHYERTGLFILPYIVTYFYLLYGTVFIYRHKSQARKYVFLPAVIFMLPIFAGSLIQFFFYGVSTVWAGVAVALVSVYVNLQNEVSCIDTLSGVYNRLYMYQYLQAASDKKKSGRKMAGIMLDIDEFKKINDSFGHITGDDAIRSAGKILLLTVKNRGIAARYGGDEFILLFQIERDEEILEMKEQLNKAVDAFNATKGKPYTLRFSKGYGVLEQKESIDSFLERIDAAMYKNKKTHKNH